jgi:anti-anti-sigma factor
MPLDPLFQIDLERDAAYAVVRAEGELDIMAAPQLCARITEAAEQSPRVVVDLRRVTFMDTFALRELLGLQAEADLASTWSLHMVPGSGIQRLLDLSGARERLRWIAPEQLASC